MKRPKNFLKKKTILIKCIGASWDILHIRFGIIPIENGSGCFSAPRTKKNCLLKADTSKDI